MVCAKLVVRPILRRLECEWCFEVQAWCWKGSRPENYAWTGCRVAKSGPESLCQVVGYG